MSVLDRTACLLMLVAIIAMFLFLADPAALHGPCDPEDEALQQLLMVDIILDLSIIGGVLLLVIWFVVLFALYGDLNKIVHSVEEAVEKLEEGDMSGVTEMTSLLQDEVNSIAGIEEKKKDEAAPGAATVGAQAQAQVDLFGGFMEQMKDQVDEVQQKAEEIEAKMEEQLGEVEVKSEQVREEMEDKVQVVEKEPVLAAVAGSKKDGKKNDRGSKATLISTDNDEDDTISDTNTSSSMLGKVSAPKKKSWKEKRKEKQEEEKEKKGEKQEEKKKKEQKEKEKLNKKDKEGKKDKDKDKDKEAETDGKDEEKKKPKHHMHKSVKTLTELVVVLVTLGLVGVLVCIIFYNIIKLLQEFNLERSSCSLRLTLALTTHVICFILMITKPLFPDAGGANVTVHTETKVEEKPAEAPPGTPPPGLPAGAEMGVNQLMEMLPGHAQMIAQMVQVMMTQISSMAAQGTLMPAGIQSSLTALPGVPPPAAGAAGAAPQPTAITC